MVRSYFALGCQRIPLLCLDMFSTRKNWVDVFYVISVSVLMVSRKEKSMAALRCFYHMARAFGFNGRRPRRPNVIVPGIDPDIVKRADPRFLEMVNRSLERNERALRELAKY